MTPTNTAHIHSLAHHTRLTPHGLGVAVSHTDVVSLSVVDGLGGVSGRLRPLAGVCKANTMGKWPTLAAKDEGLGSVSQNNTMSKGFN